MIVAGAVCVPIMSTRTRDGSIDSGDVAVGVARLFRAHVRLAGAGINSRCSCLYILQATTSRDSRVHWIFLTRTSHPRLIIMRALRSLAPTSVITTRAVHGLYKKSAHAANMHDRCK